MLLTAESSVQCPWRIILTTYRFYKILFFGDGLIHVDSREQLLWESVVYFHCLGSGNRMHVINLGGKHRHSLSHLVGPKQYKMDIRYFQGRKKKKDQY